VSNPVSVYAVFADLAEAERIGRQMVEERLAACVNILGPCRSIYRWEDDIESATETPAVFKTSRAQAESLVTRVAELHSYSVPSVSVWPIEHVPLPYAQWVEESVG
jgi:periplasmic divalent cation tolerance protein